MLKVNTRLDRSPIQGMGLYAAEFIPKGTVVWEFASEIDTVYHHAKLRSLCDQNLRTFLFIYTYYSRGLGGYVLCGDHARFVNHNEEANLYCDDRERCIAARDIAEGEEITDNYFLYDHPEGEEYIPEAYAFEAGMRTTATAGAGASSNGNGSTY